MYPHLMCDEFRMKYTPIRCEKYFSPWELKRVYIELLPGFVNNKVAGKVCRLKCSLYRLK
jgi:hypothetical protein